MSCSVPMSGTRKGCAIRAHCPFPPPSSPWQMHQLRPAFADHHVYIPRQWGCHLCTGLVSSLPDSVLAPSMRASWWEMYPKTFKPSLSTNNQKSIILYGTKRKCVWFHHVWLSRTSAPASETSPFHCSLLAPPRVRGQPDLMGFHVIFSRNQ